jgi:hypothetical protein
MPSTSKVRREPWFEALVVIEITLPGIVMAATLGLDPMVRSTHVIKKRLRRGVSRGNYD